MIADIDRRFGERLRAARERHGMSQAHLLMTLEALHGIKWHQSTVTKVEAGARPVRLQEAVAIASILRTKLEYLLEEPSSTEAQRRRSERLQGRLFELGYIQQQLRGRYQAVYREYEQSEAGEEGEDGQRQEAT